MGKVDFGINLAKNVTTFLKTGNSRSLLHKQTLIFHGINPTLTYPPTGKTFVLPRFISPEMQQARKLNQIALKQVKQPTNASFPKASTEDLRRLTSETIEDSYSRVKWTNPKDGKVYNLLKQGKTEDGNVIVRILDNDGVFIKEVKLTPKKIKIYDSDNKKIDFGKYYEEMSHGDVVTRLTRRANPFANIEYINIDHAREGSTIFKCYDNLIDEFKKLHKDFLKGDKTDYISLSIGLNPNLVQPKMILEKSGNRYLDLKQQLTLFQHQNL